MGKEYERKTSLLNYPHLYGDVILFDDFEGFFKWQSVGVGADYVVEKSDAFAYNASNSLHLKTRTTNAADGDTAQAYIFLPIRPPQAFSLRLIFHLPVTAKAKDFQALFYFFSPDSDYVAGFKYVIATGKFQFYNSLGSFADASSVEYLITDHQFVEVDLRFNLASGKYTSLRFDRFLADISDQAFYSTDPSGDAYIHQLYFTLTANGANIPEIYVDDVLLAEL